MLINELREQIKQKQISEALPIIENSKLPINEKYQILKELYRIRCIEFDSNFRKTGMTFEEWVREDLDAWVGCFWPGNKQCEDLEEYIYVDFLSNYKKCSFDMFGDDYHKIKTHSFAYDISRLLFEQILVYPKIIKSFNDINEDEIWNAFQWLLYLNKINNEDSLINYKEGLDETCDMK